MARKHFCKLFFFALLPMLMLFGGIEAKTFVGEKSGSETVDRGSGHGNRYYNNRGYYNRHWNRDYNRSYYYWGGSPYYYYNYGYPNYYYSDPYYYNSGSGFSIYFGF